MMITSLRAKQIVVEMFKVKIAIEPFLVTKLPPPLPEMDIVVH